MEGGFVTKYLLKRPRLASSFLFSSPICQLFIGRGLGKWLPSDEFKSVDSRPSSKSRVQATFLMQNVSSVDSSIELDRANADASRSAVVTR
jgi:hypothetical protein